MNAIAKAEVCPCGAPPDAICRHSGCLMRPQPIPLIRRGVYRPKLYGIASREVIDADGVRVTYRPAGAAAQRCWARLEDFAEWIRLTGAARQESTVGEA